MAKYGDVCVEDKAGSPRRSVRSKSLKIFSRALPGVKCDSAKNIEIGLKNDINFPLSSDL